MFGCLPSEALEENPQTVMAISEYRLAHQAKDQFNTNAGKMSGASAELWAVLNKALMENTDG